MIESYDPLTQITTFDYPANDDGPIRPTKQTQTATVTATSGTIWNESPLNPVKSDSDDYLITLLDPCLDPNTASIIPSVQTSSPMATNSFDNVGTLFNLVPYTTDPAYCA